MSPLVRKPEEKYKSPTKYWLLILSGISVILMLLTFVFDFPLKPLNEIVSVTVIPLQKGVSIVGEKLYSRKEMMKEMDRLMQEMDKRGENYQKMIVENTTRSYGYSSLEQAEQVSRMECRKCGR